MKNKDLSSIIFGIIFLIVFVLPLLKSGNIIFFIILLIIIVNLIKKYKLKSNINTINENIINVKNNFMSNAIKSTGRAAFGVIVAVILLIVLVNSIVIIEAGQTGVQSLFGDVRDNELQSGFHIVNPLLKIDRMTIRTEEYTMSIVRGEGKKAGADAISALTKEGLKVDLDITVLYHMNQDKASNVYEELGLNFEEKLIRPTIRSVIREIIAHYEAKDIYSEKRQEAAQKIKEQLSRQINERGIEIEEVLLRNVVLPNSLAGAIQEKLSAEQEAQKYDFLLQREEKEKQRKVIEAEGQRDAQKIINESLSTNYLYYLYISDLKSREGTIYVPTNPSTGMPLFRDLGR